MESPEYLLRIKTALNWSFRCQNQRFKPWEIGEFENFYNK